MTLDDTFAITSSKLQRQCPGAINARSRRPIRLWDPKFAKDTRRANLCGAELMGAQLNGAQLEAVNLNGADRDFAHLVTTQLHDAQLNNAQLIGAQLMGARLTGAHLNGAEMDGAHLERAYLSSAHLNGADLSGARVNKTKLANTNLGNALYAPASPPPDEYVAGIRGLTTIRAGKGEEIGLVQLRKLFEDAGLQDAAKEATYSIQRNITRDQLSEFPNAASVLGIFRIVGFEWTTAYGLHPERALRWILLLGAIFTPFYMVAILRPTKESGIMRVFPKGRLDGTAGDPADEEKVKKQLVHVQRCRKAFWTAAYFSLISAVNIGFEEFTPGDWIRRLQKREYSLEAVGWVRVVARRSGAAQCVSARNVGADTVWSAI
jgi:Pentapeptide repeats (8 copies)